MSTQNTTSVSIPTKKPITFAHIINPVKVEPDNASYLYIAQPVTFQSMLNAQNYCKNIVDITLYTAQYPEDREIISTGFNITSNLTKSIHDYANFDDKSKKLPRLIDIIQKLYDNSEADYFIYSNADIGVQKKFYILIKRLVESGHDSICIHRNDLPKETEELGVLDVSKLDKIYNMKSTSTELHPGHDCFVFKRDIVPKLNLGNVFIGYPPVGTVLREQIKANSNNFCELDGTVNLTFHLGTDVSWSSYTKTNNEYRLKNKLFAKDLM